MKKYTLIFLVVLMLIIVSLICNKHGSIIGYGASALFLLETKNALRESSKPFMKNTVKLWFKEKGNLHTYKKISIAFFLFFFLISTFSLLFSDVNSDPFLQF